MISSLIILVLRQDPSYRPILYLRQDRRMTNRLAGSRSPYLLQHQHNPVDWWPWCDEAFEEARRRDVPVFLSVGYASCHWCHVMAHESFEDFVIGRQLADDFVAIKVDREERPDVDAVYMAAVQGLTGQGGWPMSVFLDHDRRPFYAGTYFPPTPRQGSPSFGQVLTGVTDTWRNKRDQVESSAEQIRMALQERIGVLAAPEVSGITPEELIEVALAKLTEDYDSRNGGFGGAPKFPPTTVLEFLARMAALGNSQALRMTQHTCEAMSRGGIYDQLGGGFARYAVDGAWTIPHFEKMLYDNALLLRIYVHLYRVDPDPKWARVIRQTAEFLLRDLRTPEGGFASALDADAVGAFGEPSAEGRSYVWTPEQIVEVLGEADGQDVCELLGVNKLGNFEDATTVLTMSAEAEARVRERHPDDFGQWWARVRAQLLRARMARPQPELDDKVVAAWNGYAIAALAEAGAVLGVSEWVVAASQAAELLAKVHIFEAQAAGGRSQIARVSKDGVVSDSSPGVLEDYGAVAEGFIVLSGVTGNDEWLELAGELLETVLAEFRDDTGGFFDTSSEAEVLIVRPSDATDVATPSGWAQAVVALQAYGTAMADPRFLEVAEQGTRVVELLGPQVPRFAGALLSVAAAQVAGPLSIVVVGADDGPDREELMLAAVRQPSPGAVVLSGLPAPEGIASPFAGRPMVDGQAAAYVCRGTTCSLPITTAEALAGLINSGGK